MQMMHFSSKCCLLFQVGLCQDFSVVFHQYSKKKNKNGAETSCKCSFYPCPVQKHMDLTRFIQKKKNQTHCSVHGVYFSSLVSLLSSPFAPPGSSQDHKTSWIQISMFCVPDRLPQLCFPVPFPHACWDITRNIPPYIIFPNLIINVMMHLCHKKTLCAQGQRIFPLAEEGLSTDRLTCEATS